MQLLKCTIITIIALIDPTLRRISIVQTLLGTLLHSQHLVYQYLLTQALPLAIVCLLSELSGFPWKQLILLLYFET